jgi:aldose 1-epimerase
MISCYPFGSLADGTPVTRYRLTGGNGAYVDILDYGGTVASLVVPDKDGVLRDVVLGYDSLEGYIQGQLYFGATVGRHANRIGGGTFTLNGTTYELEKNSGPNHSHGGFRGYEHRMFQGETQGDTLLLHLHSPDGDQGYPGELNLTVSFSFSQENALTIHYQATTSRDTVVNLTNHSYFDLSGGADPMSQLLRLSADAYTENDENTLPTGVISPVEGTPFDFRQEKALGRDIGVENQQLQFCRGYDHNFVLGNGGAFLEFARLRSPETGITMTAATDMPGVQLYTGNFIEEPKGKRPYGPRDGVCLETQFFPNAMAIPAFQKPILRAGAVYDHQTVYAFSV